MSNKRLEAFQALEYVPFIKEKKKKKDIHFHKHKYTYTMLCKIIQCFPSNIEGQGSLACSGAWGSKESDTT